MSGDQTGLSGLSRGGSDDGELPTNRSSSPSRLCSAPSASVRLDLKGTAVWGPIVRVRPPPSGPVVVTVVVSHPVPRCLAERPGGSLAGWVVAVVWDWGRADSTLTSARRRGLYWVGVLAKRIVRTTETIRPSIPPVTQIHMPTFCAPTASATMPPRKKGSPRRQPPQQAGDICSSLAD